QLLLHFAHLHAGNFLDRLIEHFARIRIADHFGVADHERVADGNAFARAAVDVHLAVRRLHDAAPPWNLRQLVDHELDRLAARCFDGLADVVILVAARFRSDTVAIDADRETLLRRRADHALRCEHLSGR